MRYGLSALFLAMAGSAVICLWSSPSSYTYVHTGRPNDITVIGNGWLYGTDVKSDKRTFFKSCTLSINRYSTLVADISNGQVQIEPSIPVEGPVENLRCSPEGRISVFLEDSSIHSQCGQLELAVALSPAKSYVLDDEQLLSTPVMYTANSSTGYLQSGWLLKQESLLDRFQKISFGELAILFVASGILILLFRLTRSRLSDTVRA